MLISVAARLYYAEKGSRHWKRFKEAGALSLNTCNDIYYFKLIDLDEESIAWEQEIYLDFRYYKDEDNFHSFEADKGMIGILFADSQEAEQFYQTVLEQTQRYTSAERMPSKSGAGKSKSILGVFGFGKKSSRKKDEDSAAKDDSDSASIKSETVVKGKKKKDADLTHDDVSEPRDFTHLSHIGFNPEKGTFDIQNIPSEWKTLFAKAGITQDQLENKSTAQFIAGFVQDSEPQMQEMMKKQKAKPPAPVPLKKKMAPPPPPAPIKKAPTSPLKASQKSKASMPPPPPPKKKQNLTKTTGTAIPPPPPAPPSSVSNASVAVPSNHSALLESIRGAGMGILKPPSKDSKTSQSSGPASPAPSDPHSALMASIKSGASLKPAQKIERTPSSPTSSVSSSDPTDMMAAMLAKALAARNKKLAADSSDEEEDSDDSRW